MNCDCDKNLKECNCEKATETAETAIHIGFDAFIDVLEEEQQDCGNCDC